MILIIPIIFMLAFAWFAYAFPQLFAFTAVLTEWCQNLFFQCLEKLFVVKMFLVWVGFFIVAGWLLHALVKKGVVLLKTYRQLHTLPLVYCGDVVIIKDDTLKTAFTHGLFRPKVYVSTGLINSLDGDELRAVYLHELHHKDHQDPLRLFLLSLFKDAFSYIPLSAYIEKFFHYTIEAKADDAVVDAMKEPVSLAGALLKVVRFHSDSMMLQQASIEGTGSIEKRVLRIVEGVEEKVKPPALKTILASIFMAGFLTLSLTFPLVASLPFLKQCDTTHCSLHMDTQGVDCKTHCEDLEHRH